MTSEDISPSWNKLTIQSYVPIIIKKLLSALSYIKLATQLTRLTAGLHANSTKFGTKRMLAYVVIFN